MESIGRMIDCNQSHKKKKMITESTVEEVMDFSPMELLPTEILQKILTYLPVRDRVRVERVCKRWKNVSTERLWRDVQILFIEQFENESLLSYDIFSDFHEFRESKLLSFNDFNTGINEFAMIQSLVSRAGQHVKVLIIDPFHGNSKSVLSVVAEHCFNIESIHLHNVDYSDIEVISRLLKNNKQLHSITCCKAVNVIEILPLRDWKSLSFVSLMDPVTKYFIIGEKLEEKVVALIENSPSLEKFYFDNLTAKILTAISKCEQLKDLFFPVMVEIGREDFIRFYTPLLNGLTCLTVEERDDETDRLIDLLPHCINLENLHLLRHYYELPDELQEAVLALPKLESLELDVFELTDDFLNRLLRLKYLRIRGHARGITEDGIFKMIMNSECLEKLEISNINVTTELFKRLAENTSDFREILKIRVSFRSYKEAWKICKGSRIHILKESLDIVKEIRHWRS